MCHLIWKSSRLTCNHPQGYSISRISRRIGNIIASAKNPTIGDMICGIDLRDRPNLEERRRRSGSESATFLFRRLLLTKVSCRYIGNEVEIPTLPVAAI